MRLSLISPAVAAVLAAAIIWTPLPHDLTGGADDVANPVGSAPPSAAVTLAAITPSHAATFVHFGPEVTADASGVAAAPEKPAPPALVGLIGSGPRRIAYVLIGGQTVRAGLWDKVGPWRLTAIGPRSVRLSAGARSLALALYGPRPQPPPPPQAANADLGIPAPTPAVPVAPPARHGLEPASAPPPRTGHARYWAGPPGSAPPGYILLKPGEAPPSSTE